MRGAAAGAADSAGGGRGGRGGAHVGGGLKVHPLRHEALEGGEVALLRRLGKSRSRLRAQPFALSTVAGGKGWARLV